MCVQHLRKNYSDEILPPIHVPGTSYNITAQCNLDYDLSMNVLDENGHRSKNYVTSINCEYLFLNYAKICDLMTI